MVMCVITVKMACILFMMIAIMTLIMTCYSMWYYVCVIVHVIMTYIPTLGSYYRLSRPRTSRLGCK